MAKGKRKRAEGCGSVFVSLRQFNEIFQERESDVAIKIQLCRFFEN